MLPTFVYFFTFCPTNSFPPFSQSDPHLSSDLHQNLPSTPPKPQHQAFPHPRLQMSPPKYTPLLSLLALLTLPQSISTLPYPPLQSLPQWHPARSSPPSPVAVGTFVGGNRLPAPARLTSNSMFTNVAPSPGLIQTEFFPETLSDEFLVSGGNYPPPSAPFPLFPAVLASPDMMSRRYGGVVDGEDGRVGYLYGGYGVPIYFVNTFRRY
eukprot:Sdes_comp22978_c0_seq1m21326